MHKFLASVCLLLSLAACTERQAAPLYMVSIEPQRAVLEALLDSGTIVSTMLERGADPETFEPTMAQRLAAADAALFFATGVLPFEAKLTADGQRRIVDTSVGIDPIYGTHNHCHEGIDVHDHADELPDPHYWTSLSGLRVMAHNMTVALCEREPARTELYNARLAAFEHTVDSLDNLYRTRLSDAPGRSFAVWHPSLSYFARDFGLRQIALGQEDKEMSARQVRAAIDSARVDSVRVFFIQREYDTRQAEAISDGIGSRLVTIDPLAYDWEEQLSNIVNELDRP